MFSNDKECHNHSRKLKEKQCLVVKRYLNAVHLLFMFWPSVQGALSIRAIAKGPSAATIITYYLAHTLMLIAVIPSET